MYENTAQQIHFRTRRCQKLPLYQKMLQIKNIKDSIGYQKGCQLICLSNPLPHRGDKRLPFSKHQNAQKWQSIDTSIDTIDTFAKVAILLSIPIFFNTSHHQRPTLASNIGIDIRRIVQRLLSTTTFLPVRLLSTRTFLPTLEPALVPKVIF